MIKKTTKTQETTTSLQAAGRKPTHRLYAVTGEGETANWTTIGAAWAHKDDGGYNIALDAIPLQGRIVMRAISEN